MIDHMTCHHICGFYVANQFTMQGPQDDDSSTKNFEWFNDYNTTKFTIWLCMWMTYKGPPFDIIVGHMS